MARFIIDTLLFFCIGALAGIGLILKFVFVGPAGRQLTFLGLGGQDWRIIHPLLGFTVLALLVIHQIFHWEQVRLFYRTYMGGVLARKIIAAIFLIVFVLFLVLPFIIQPEIAGR
jgi:uncharacterized membrane protein